MKTNLFFSWALILVLILTSCGGNSSSKEKKTDLEDMLQCLCAKENKCQILLTSDNAFYNCGIKVFTIDEFMEEYSIRQ